jgi:hypothetical protein
MPETERILTATQHNNEVATHGPDQLGFRDFVLGELVRVALYVDGEPTDRKIVGVVVGGPDRGGMYRRAPDASVNVMPDELLTLTGEETDIYGTCHPHQFPTGSRSYESRGTEYALEWVVRRSDGPLCNSCPLLRMAGVFTG